VAEVHLSDPDAVWDALNRLASIDPPVDARPHHLFFGAVIWSRIKEGDDPEPSPRPDAPDKVRAAYGEGAKVAVVDNGIAKESLGDPLLATGVEFDGDDIDPKAVYEIAKGTPPGTLDVGAGHGTFVAGVIRQLAPACTVRIIRSLASAGVAPEEQVAEGILQARDWGADLVNLSFGGYTESDQPPILLERAIRSLPSEVIVVAAAGNEGTDRPIFPGAIRRVVSVAATDQRGNDHGAPVTDLAPYSNYGWWVDTAAPGMWRSTFVTGLENPALDPQPDVFEEPFAESGGTSFAAAAVTGALAALLDAEDCPEPREALRRLLARPANRRLPWGGTSVDVWGAPTV
jgi:subtilisin family serine protease